MADTAPVEPPGKRSTVVRDTEPTKGGSKTEPTCVSMATFFWILPHLFNGYTLKLSDENMPLVFKRLESKGNTDKALNRINEQKTKGTFHSIKPIIFQQGNFHLRLGVFISLCQGVLNNFGRPLVLKLVIDAAMPGSNYTDQDIISIVMVFGAVIFFEVFCNVHVRQIVSTEFCSSVVSWLVPVIHQKIMRVRPSWTYVDKAGASREKSKASFNNESAIIGNDIIRGFEEVKWTCAIVQNSVGMIAGIVALFILLGWNCLVGIGVMAIVLTCNLQIAKCSERVTKKELEATDSRMSTMKEVIDGIQQVKLGAWEENYLSSLSAKRAHEIGFTLRARLFQICNVGMGRGCPILAGCMTFVFMGLQNIHPSGTSICVTCRIQLYENAVDRPANEFHSIVYAKFDSWSYFHLLKPARDEACKYIGFR